MVLVTHDRYLLDRVTNIILSLDGADGVGTYADLAQWQAAQENRQRTPEPVKGATPAAKGTVTPSPKSPAAGSKRLSYKEQRELEGMEAKIHSLEESLVARQRRMEEPEIMSDHVKLRACCEELEAVQTELNRLYARWEELEATAGG
jgi:ATP-binding cassette subfamily F protein uup